MENSKNCLILKDSEHIIICDSDTLNVIAKNHKVKSFDEYYDLLFVVGKDITNEQQQVKITLFSLAVIARETYEPVLVSSYLSEDLRNEAMKPYLKNESKFMFVQTNKTETININY